MGKARQTFERRQLGLTLRRLREQAGASQQAAAERVGKARSQLVELEDGRGTLAPDVLAKLLDFYGVSEDERQTAVELGALARARQKRRAYTDLLPGSFQRFADLEAGATETKTLRFVITEDSLTGAVGSPEVMREQRRHILKLLESNDNLTVQVLRSETYGNPARGGGMTILGFGDKGPPVGFSAVVFGPSTYFDQESDTADQLRAFRRLLELALDPNDSVRLIRRIDKEN